MDDLIAGISDIRLYKPAPLSLTPNMTVCATEDIARDTILGYIKGEQMYIWECDHDKGVVIIDDTYVIDAGNNILSYIREGSLHGLVRNCTLFIEGGPGTEQIGMKTIADIPRGAELSYYAGILE